MQRIRGSLVEFGGQWSKLARAESLVLEWREGAMA